MITVTNASYEPPLQLPSVPHKVWNAPVVVGNAGERVAPVTKAFFEESNAIVAAKSPVLPPR